MNIVLVAGFAGSGKTEVAKALAREFGWALIDKDTLTRPLLEEASKVVCGDADDRQSEAYLDVLRPLEYQCLMDTIWEVVHHGCSVVVTAPFLREVADARWCEETEFEASFADSVVHWVWVRTDLPTMRSRLTNRRASRDRWKLANWDAYAASVDLQLRPAVDTFHIVENPDGSSLAVVAENLIDEIRAGLNE